MRFDTFCMAAVVAELRQQAAGLFLDRISQPGPLRLQLSFSGAGRRKRLLIDASARYARVHLVEQREAAPAEPPAFCMLLRKHLQGTPLREVRMPCFDRILDLQFSPGGVSRTLVIEIMGRHSNSILLDQDGVVIDSLKRVPPAASRVRPVLPGLPYSRPPGDRIDPGPLTLDELKRALGPDADASSLVRQLAGFGPFAAEQACATGSDAADGAARLLQRCAAADFEPSLLFSTDGRMAGCWAFCPVAGGWICRPAASMSGACEEFYRRAESEEASAAARGALRGALTPVLNALRRRMESSRAALDAKSSADELRICGELLQAAGKSIPRGEENVTLPNWYAPGRAGISIALDPTLDTQENAARYFRQYRRALAAAREAERRLPELTRSVEQVSAALARLEAAPDELLPQLQAEFAQEGWLDRRPPAGAAARKEEPEWPAGVRIRRLTLDGWEILWGETAVSNDYLTQRVAAPHDLWLHARAVTGSHVVVRGVRDLERLPRHLLHEAALIAARHSAARHSSHVAVDYTFRRYVRKPRRSAAGPVTYTHESTLHVSP